MRILKPSSLISCPGPALLMCVRAVFLGIRVDSLIEQHHIAACASGSAKREFDHGPAL